MQAINRSPLLPLRSPQYPHGGKHRPFGILSSPFFCYGGEESVQRCSATAAAYSLPAFLSFFAIFRRLACISMISSCS